VAISTGNENDALLALVEGRWAVLRFPNPLSFYAEGLDGRIDDTNAGWKAAGCGRRATTGAVVEGTILALQPRPKRSEYPFKSK
jgi:hypothetical protein